MLLVPPCLGGGRLRGVCAVCHTGSSAVHGVLRRLFGQAARFVPLLTDILELLVRHHLAQDVHRICYEANVVAD